MKKNRTILRIGIALIMCMSVSSFSSCRSCMSTTEEAASWLYDANVDLDNDGDSGDRSGEYNPSFRGSSNRKSCNIRSHKCSGGIDLDKDGYCDICEANGYECHMVKHH